jgi:hypothetical protein
MKRPEIELLAMYLSDRAKECAAVVTFDEMSSQIGVDIKSKRHYLSSAMELLAKEYGVVLKSIRSIGYRVLKQSEIPQTISQKRQSRIESQTNFWDREMKAVNIGCLSQRELKEYVRYEGRLTVQKILIAEENQRKVDEISARRGARKLTDTEFARKAIMALKDVT